MPDEAAPTPQSTTTPALPDAELLRRIQAHRANVARQARKNTVGDLDNYDPVGAAKDAEEEHFNSKWTLSAFGLNPRGPSGGDIGGFAGGIAGASAGQKIGGMVGFPGTGAAIGSLMGSMAGGGSGEAASQYLRDEPFNTVPILREAIRQGKYDIMGLGLNVAAKGAFRAFTGKPIASALAANERLSRLSQEVQGELIGAGHSSEVAKEMGESFATLGQVVEGRLLKFTEEAAGASAFAKRLPNKLAAQDDAAEAIIEHMEKRVGPLLTDAQVSRAVVDRWKEAWKGRKAALGGFYNDIAQRLDTTVMPAIKEPISGFGTNVPIGRATQMSGAAMTARGGVGRELIEMSPAQRVVTETGTQAGMVDMRPLRDALGATRKIIRELEQDGISVPQIGLVTDTVNEIGKSDRVSFAVAQRLRGHIAELEDNLVLNQVALGGGFGTAMKKPRHAAEFEEIRSLLSSQMYRAADDFDKAIPKGAGKIGELLRAVDGEYADAANLYNNAVYRGWISMADQKLLGHKVIGEMMEPRAEEKLTHIVRSLENTPELAKVRRWHLDSIRQSMTDKNGAFDAAGYLDSIKRSFGTRSAQILHGPEMVKDIMQVANDLKVFRGRPSAGGDFAMRLAETGPLLAFFTRGAGIGAVLGGGAGAAATGNPVGAAVGAAAGAVGSMATIGITVTGFNKLLTNPKRIKDVMKLTTMSPRSGKAAATVIRLLSALSDEDIVNSESGKRISMSEARARYENRRAVRKELQGAQ